MFGFFWRERKQYFLLQFSVMGLRNVQGFEQMTTSGPVPASETRQNGARRHSHSFRPLHDVGGIKAPPPTLPQKNARGMVVYLFASHAYPSPSSPPPTASASCQWEHAEALHSCQTHTHTYWTARVRGERRGREMERCDVVTVEWLVYTQSLEEEQNME